MDQSWIADRIKRYFAGETSEEADREIAWQVATERLLRQVLDGEYREAYFGLRQERSLAKEDKPFFIDAVNQAYVLEREMEWTNHGFRRSFRFWSRDEKIDYLRGTLDLIDVLRVLTPHVSFGFGAVLAFVRDGDFIPHDDDVDVLIAFEPSSGLTDIPAARRLLESTLTEHEYVHGGPLPTHLNVRRRSGPVMDVFIGMVEGEDVSWFPSRRRNLRMEQVFPTATVDFLGVRCPFPRKPEEYLVATYGEDWRDPIPHWNHPWNRREYADLLLEE